MNKLISVIIPVKNGEQYLEPAITGIKNQNMDVEIIVVDDASTDSTAAIAERLGCKVLHHEVCKGQVAGKNTGLAVAKGEYVMFHDADDVMRDGVLKKMYLALEEDASVGAVMAMVQDFISPDLTEEEAKGTIIKTEPYYGLFTGAVLIRKTVFDTVGLFDEKLNAGEIIEWKMKLDQKGIGLRKLDFVSTSRRVHNNNYGKTNRKKEFENYASVLRARMALRAKK